MQPQMTQILQQAQKMQQKLQQAQQEVEQIEREGTSGAGMVKLTLNGKFQARKIVLDVSLLNNNEKDVLEDLIVAAINDAHQKIEQASQELMSKVTAGMPLPPGMKLPF